MRKYYDLHDDMRIPGRWVLDDPMIDIGCDPSEFRVGRPFERGFTPVIDIHTQGIAVDFTETLLSVPVLSSRLVKVLSPLYGQDVQRIPVRLGNRVGYEVLNALRLIRCLDESRSNYIKWTEKDSRPDKLGHYRSIPRIRLDVSLIPPGLNFFRLWGWKVVLVVSQEVVDAFRSIDATGAKFEPLFDE